jgi:Flp pilus assembly protein TadG
MSSQIPPRAFATLHDDRGNSAAEFALVLPILVVMLFGFYEVGRLIYSYSIVSAAVRDASRYAARQQMGCSGFTDSTQQATVQRLTRTGTVDTGGSSLLPGWTSDSSVTVSISCLSNPVGNTTYAGLYDNVPQIPIVKVTAAAPYTSEMTALLPALRLSTITVSHSEVWTEQ